MTSIVVGSESLVSQECSVGMNHDVDMSGSAGVVTREDGLELSNTIRVGLLDSSKPSLVNVRFVGLVAVTARYNTGVNTGRVAVPHLEVDIGDGITSLDVDDLIVEDDVEALLVFDKVLTDILAGDIYPALALPTETNHELLTVRTLGDLRSQDARVDACEKGSRISAPGEPLISLVMRSGQNLIGISLLQSTLLASPLDLNRTASDVASFDATSLELVGTVSEGRSLDRVEEVATLCGFMSDVVSGVG